MFHNLITLLAHHNHLSKQNAYVFSHHFTKKENIFNQTSGQKYDMQLKKSKRFLYPVFFLVSDCYCCCCNFHLFNKHSRIMRVIINIIKFHSLYQIIYFFLFVIIIIIILYEMTKKMKQDKKKYFLANYLM